MKTVIMAAIAALHKTRAEQPAPYSCYCTERAANELRRLHEENQEMLEALKAIIEDIDSEHGTGYEYAKARAVVDKGEEMKTVIEMAREAGFLEHKDSFYTNHRYGDCKFELERLVELARADEREACLDLAKDFAHNNIDLHDAIRARGNT